MRIYWHGSGMPFPPTQKHLEYLSCLFIINFFLPENTPGSSDWLKILPEWCIQAQLFISLLLNVVLHQTLQDHHENDSSLWWGHTTRLKNKQSWCGNNMFDLIMSLLTGITWKRFQSFTRIHKADIANILDIELEHLASIYNISLRSVDVLSYLGIAAEVARGKRVGGCEGGGRGYGGQGAIWTSSSSTATLLSSSSLALTGPATPKDPAPQGGRAAGGAAWRVTGRTGDKKRHRERFSSGETRGNSTYFITKLCSVKPLMPCNDERLQACPFW